MASHANKGTSILPKLIIAIIIIVLIGGLVYFFLIKKDESKTVGGTENKSIFASKELTAEEIANKLKEKISSVGKIVVYTEETDLNKLLGRPNQYTSKATFEDTRLEQVNADNEFLSEEERNEPTGGTIEVFSNKDDMESRKEYTESLSASMPMLNQYIYAEGNALLRLDNDLTPTQAQEYEQAFKEIMN